MSLPGSRIVALPAAREAAEPSAKRGVPQRAPTADAGQPEESDPELAARPNGERLHSPELAVEGQHVAIIELGKDSLSLSLSIPEPVPFNYP